MCSKVVQVIPMDDYTVFVYFEDGKTEYKNSRGYYWSSTPNSNDDTWDLFFHSENVKIDWDYNCNGQSVRLIQN